jgi:hypothetical protein
MKIIFSMDHQSSMRALLSKTTLILMMIQAVFNATVSSIFTTTGSGLDSSIGSVMDTMHYKSYSNGPNAHLFFTNVSPATLSIFDRSGNQLFSGVFPTGTVGSEVVAKDPLQVVFLVDGKNYGLLNFTYSPPVLIFSSTIVNLYTSNIELVGIIQLANTDYVIFGDMKSNNKLVKVNFGVDPPQSIVSSNTINSILLGSDFSADYSQFGGGNYLAFVSALLGNIIVGSVSTMMEVKSWPTGYPFSYLGNSILDNLSESHFYAQFISGATLGLIDVDVTVLTTSTIKYNHALLRLVDAAHLQKPLNLGPYRYLALVASSSLLLISKPRFALAETFTLATTAMDFSLNGPEQSSESEFHFSFVFSGTGNNFQSYTITFDLCLHRSSTIVCEECFSGYYRLTEMSGNKCISLADTPAGFGKDATATIPLIRACSSSFCDNCVSDYTICTACSTKDKYYLDTVTSKCVYVLNIPAGFGANSELGTVVPCNQAAACQLCQSNYSICTQCDKASKWYLQQDTGKCLSPADMPKKFGANLVNGFVEGCTSVGCIYCSDNINLCTGCDSTSLYYLDKVASTCIYVDDISPGKGADLTDNTIKSCADSAHCLICNTNIQKCTSCDHISLYYLDTTLNSCVYVDDIAGGYGADLTDYQIKVCDDTECSRCNNNISICKLCDYASLYYLNTTSNSCVYVQNIQSGYGADLTTYEIGTCSDVHCTDCNTNIVQCGSCDFSSLFYLNTTSSSCTYFENIPSGFGPDLFDNTIKQCKDAHCITCNTDNTNCSLCDFSNLYYLDTTTLACIYVDNIQSGQGADLTDYKIKPCTDINCIQCNTDVSKCSLCNYKSSFYLYPSNYSCLVPTSFPESYGLSISTNTVVQCLQGTSCLNCSMNHTFCTKCATGWFLDESSGICYDINSILLGFGADLQNSTVKRCLDNCESCQANYIYCTNCAPNFTVQSDGTCISTCIQSIECLECVANPSICTKCDSGHGFYLSPSIGFCYSTQTMPNRFGVDTSSNLVASCIDKNCLSCSANISNCINCNVASLFYLYQANSSCLNSLTMPTYFGPNLSSSFVVPCAQSPSCEECATDNSICTKCSVVSGLYLHSANHTCLAPPNIPAGFGADLEARVTRTCAEYPRCQLCSSNYLNCELCQHDQGYFLDTNTGLCVHTSNITQGYGANLATLQISPCVQLPSCIECNNDHRLCSKCDSSLGSFLYPYNMQCLTSDSFPISYGPNLTDNTLQPCISAGCLKCQTDNSVCTQCNKAASYYLYEKNTTCLQPPSIPLGQGPNLILGIVSPCLQPACLQCSFDNSICDACSTLSGTCRDPESNTCLLFSSLPSHTGCNLLTGIISSCRDPACSNCSSNSSHCSECDLLMGFYFDTDSGKCLDFMAAPLGTGLDRVALTLVPCLSRGCLDCRADFSVCTFCDGDNSFVLSGGQCFLKAARTLDIRRRQVTAVPAQVRIQFSEIISLVPGSLSARLETFIGQKWEGDEFLPITVDQDTIVVSFLIEENVEKGKLTIDRKNINGERSPVDSLASREDSTRFFLNFPIIIERISILNSHSIRQTVQVVQSTVAQVNNARAGATLVLATSNPAIAVMLDKMFCDFTYMSLLGAQNQTYPSLLLNMVSDSKIIPFSIPNLFAPIATDRECKPAFAMQTNGYDCNFLSNYGEDILMLAGTFAVNLFFSLLVYLTKCLLRFRPNLRYTRTFIVAYTFFRSFGLQYFLMKMDGNLLEVVIFSVNSLLTLPKAHNTRGATIGAIVSIIAFLYYIIYAICLWRACRSLATIVVEKRHVTNNKEAKELQDAFNLAHLDCSFLAFAFEGYRYPIHPSLLYTPLFSVMKYLTVGTVAVLTSDWKLGQLAILFFAESAHYIYTLRAHVKAYTVENVGECLACGCRVLYVLVSALTFTEAASENPNNIAGICQVLLLLSTVAIDVGIILCLIVHTTYDWIAERTCRRKERELQVVMEKKERREKALENQKKALNSDQPLQKSEIEIAQYSYSNLDQNKSKVEVNSLDNDLFSHTYLFQASSINLNSQMKLSGQPSRNSSRKSYRHLFNSNSGMDKLKMSYKGQVLSIESPNHSNEEPGYTRDATHERKDINPVSPYSESKNKEIGTSPFEINNRDSIKQKEIIGQTPEQKSTKRLRLAKALEEAMALSSRRKYADVD